MKKLLAILALVIIVNTGATTKKFYHVKVTLTVNTCRITETIMVPANSSQEARKLAIDMARRRISVKILQVSPDKP